MLLQAFIQTLVAVEARSKVRGENGDSVRLTPPYVPIWDNFLLDLYAQLGQGGYREARQVKGYVAYLSISALHQMSIEVPGPSLEKLYSTLVKHKRSWVNVVVQTWEEDGAKGLSER